MAYNCHRMVAVEWSSYVETTSICAYMGGLEGSETTERSTMLKDLREWLGKWEGIALYSVMSFHLNNNLVKHNSSQSLGISLTSSEDIVKQLNTHTHPFQRPSNSSHQIALFHVTQYQSITSRHPFKIFDQNSSHIQTYKLSSIQGDHSFCFHRFITGTDGFPLFCSGVFVAIRFGFIAMGSSDRSKKRVQLWKKAVFHFLLCFVMGFFTGFAPTSTTSMFSMHVESKTLNQNYGFSPEPVEKLHQGTQFEILNRSLMAEIPVAVPVAAENSIKSAQYQEYDEAELVPRKQLILITSTKSNDRFQEVFIRRLSHTFKLVPQPLLWIVVESSPNSESSALSEILRKTGIMYRHVVYNENFTDSEAEMDHQRNLALNHIEHHRLNGIIHFAGVYNIYDLEFFQRIREIENFGTWPIAKVSANRKRVVMEGPVCEFGQVVGWHILRKTIMRVVDANNNIIGSVSSSSSPPSLSISSFAFNSSILWDPERWGRSSSIQDASQNSIKFVQEMVLEDETKLKGLPNDDCSKIMLWHLRLPTQTSIVHYQTSTSMDAAANRR